MPSGAAACTSAPLLLRSVDFAEIAALQQAGEWDTAGLVLAQAARDLEKAGAGAVLLATNTMHKVAGAIEQAVDIPLLHIVDAAAQAIRAACATNSASMCWCLTRERAKAPHYLRRTVPRYYPHLITRYVPHHLAKTGGPWDAGAHSGLH